MKKIFFLIFCITIIHSSEAQIKVASVFTDNMVLQQGMNVPVWGTAKPGEKLVIKIAGTRTEAVADKSGQWMARTPMLDYGGPYELTVSGSEDITFKNVMVGEVWFASGQSNMEFTMPSVKNAKEEIDSAQYPDIRFFNVALNVSNQPLDYVKGHWQECNPESVRSLSAVAYFFARDLHLKKHVAVGVIVASWGGSPAEPFVSAQSLWTMPDFKDKLTALKNQKKDWFNIFHEFEDSLALFRNSNNGYEAGFYKKNYDDKTWENVNYPLTKSSMGTNDKYGNNIWLRKSFTLSSKEAGKSLKIDLGAINGTETIYCNGRKLDSFEDKIVRRLYIIPPHLITKGKNEIVVHFVEMWGGSIGSKNDTAKLSDGLGHEILLDNKWKINSSFEEKVPEWVSSNTIPSTIYNGMIKPVIPYGIKGALWYQGESNASRAFQYRKLLPLLITDWRIRWKEGNFPFLIVQIANFKADQSSKTGSEWAELREAQSRTLQYPNTGMAVTIDIGDSTNIHPKDKQDVGYRLFLAAQKIAYHQNLVYSGPTYKSNEVKESQIDISFNHIGSGLVSKNNLSLTGFTIAGADQIFYPAEATIENNEVVVHSDKVSHPVAVRYGWAQSPDCNLYNKEALPASPFRTDDWQMITKENK